MTREEFEGQPKRGRGRPKEEGIYRHNVRIRLDDRDFNKLDIIADATGDTHSDVLRVAINAYYNQLRRECRIG